MRKKLFLSGLMTLFLTIALIPILARQEFLTFRTQYSAPWGGWLLANFDVGFQATYFTFSRWRYYTMLSLPLFIAGFLTGIVVRNPFQGLTGTVFGGLLMGIIYDILFVFLHLPVSEFSSLSLEPFLLLNIIDGVIAGSFAGLFGLLGGKLNEKSPSPTIPTVNLEELYTSCPNCDSKYFSNPLFCSNCGAQLREETNSVRGEDHE